MTLTSRHLQLLIDYEKFGVRESGVLFHVIRPPQHGRLSSTLWRRADEAATFTLLDVHSDRVRYVHDGSETVRDSALLELELAPRGGFLLPAYLQKRHRHLQRTRDCYSGKLCSTYNWKDLGNRSSIEVLP